MFGISRKGLASDLTGLLRNLTNCLAKGYTMNRNIVVMIACLLILHGLVIVHPANARPGQQQMKEALKLAPLKHPRGDRMPLYFWLLRTNDLPLDEQTEGRLRDLDARGLGMYTTWYPNNPKNTAHGIAVAKIQKKLGLPVAVMVHPCLATFFNGDPDTLHVDADGKPFHDGSFASSVKMGCPFALKQRYAPMRKQLMDVARAYKEAGIEIDIAFADWEIDGPIEWNDAWANSKKCARCRSHIPNIGNFGEFQGALRIIRSEIQRECYAEPMKKLFPGILVGNYAVNPHGGIRYWYDYFEKLPAGAPYIADQRARYRPWFHEFSLTGYNYANPVVYTWYDTFKWYDFENTDYRWFYNMLLVASNTCAHTERGIPIIAWMHWHTTVPPKDGPKVAQFSEEKYQELLWHMLLRGVDTFSNWCLAKEFGKELALIQEVYADSLEYREFLDNGVPITFDVPKQQGPVVSGLQLGNRLLIRRTDFDDTKEPVEIMVDGKTIRVPRTEGKCQILELK